jgi:hypothetical protein
MTTTSNNHARLYSIETLDFPASFAEDFSLEFVFKTEIFEEWKDIFVIEQPQSTHGSTPNRLECRIFGPGMGAQYNLSSNRLTIRDYYHKTGLYSNGKFNATDAPLQDNTFYHVVYTHKNNPYGDAYRKMYLNGTLQTTYGNSYGGNGDLPTTGNNYLIKLGYIDGSSPNQSDTWKYFKIYNRELTATEVSALNTGP